MERDLYKSDSSEMHSRVNECYLLILQGFQRKSIIQFFTEKYKVGERQIDNYIAKARIEFENDIEKNTDYKKNEILVQLYDLYNKSYQLEDYKECRSILQQISDVLGIKAPIKTDLTTNGKEIKQNVLSITTPDGTTLNDFNID